jgi:NitT/TauT family transport system substrate-binding protein
MVNQVVFVVKALCGLISILEGFVQSIEIKSLWNHQEELMQRRASIIPGPAIHVLLLMVLLSACSSVPSTPTTENARTTTVRLAYFPNLTHAAALVGVARGTFQNAFGSNVMLDLKTFNAGPALIEALFAGEIDIAYIGPNPAINGYVRSNGQALRIIAGATSGGASFIVRPDSNITQPQDLAGKTFATPQLGNTQDVALRYYLAQQGLTTADKGGTVTIVPTQNPDILTLFQQGQIDGAWVPEPWAARLILEGKGKVFLDERNVWPEGRFVTTHVIVSTKFLNDHPDLVQAFLKAHVDTVTYINQNPDETKRIVNAEIERITTRGLSQEVLDTAWETMQITYDPLPQSLFISADHAFNLGFLGDNRPDLTNIYALELLNTVLKDAGLPMVDQ